MRHKNNQYLINSAKIYIHIIYIYIYIYTEETVITVVTDKNLIRKIFTENRYAKGQIKTGGVYRKVLSI